MTRYLYAAVSLGLISVAIPLRAANRPRAGTDSQNTVVWTNDDLERLHDLGLICIEQAARLRDELERRRAQLGGYRQAIEDARSLKTMTGGINLDAGDIGITPEAGIEILQQRVSEAKTELDALEDLARRNDIPPGTLRGQ